MDYGRVALGDIVLIPLIIGLIQATKRFFPQADTNIWFGLSFLLGLVFQVVVFLIANGESIGGWTLALWALCIVSGLSFGLAAGKAYDESLGKAG